MWRSQKVIWLDVRGEEVTLDFSAGIPYSQANGMFLQLLGPIAE